VVSRDGAKIMQTVRKVGGNLQAVAQIEIFREIWDSGRSEGSKKRTKEGRVKTRLSFRTVCKRFATRENCSKIAGFERNVKKTVSRK
jgi:hypothetical protein